MTQEIRTKRDKLQNHFYWHEEVWRGERFLTEPCLLFMFLRKWRMFTSFILQCFQGAAGFGWRGQEGGGVGGVQGWGHWALQGAFILQKVFQSSRSKFTNHPCNIPRWCLYLMLTHFSHLLFVLNITWKKRRSLSQHTSASSSKATMLDLNLSCSLFFRSCSSFLSKLCLNPFGKN